MSILYLSAPTYVAAPIYVTYYQEIYSFFYSIQGSQR